MISRKIPRLGAAVSELGLGTAQLANTDGRQPGMRHVPADEVQRILAAMQVLYNMLVTETDGLIRAAAAEGLLVVARSPINSGVLSGAYTAATTFPADDERSGYLAGDYFVARMRAVAAIQAELGAE